MKYFAFIFILFAGCAVQKTELQNATPLPPMPQQWGASSAQPEAVLTVIQPHTVYWSPGGYTNFVVLTTSDLLMPINKWAVYLETQETNFQFQTDEPQQRFFTLYGTNNDGQSDWITK